jgi:hypothetical protein
MDTGLNIFDLFRGVWGITVNSINFYSLGQR